MARNGQTLANQIPPGRKPAVGGRLAPIRTRRVFEEICERIRNQLISGELKPRDRLPLERELAEFYNVSRTTVHDDHLPAKQYRAARSKRFKPGLRSPTLPD